MVIPEFHIKPRGKRWAVIQKVGSRYRTIGVYRRPTAILRGRAVARAENGTLMIHGDYGPVADRLVFMPLSGAQIRADLRRVYAMGAGWSSSK